MLSNNLRTYARFARQHGRRFIDQRRADAGKPIPATLHRPDPKNWSDSALTIAWLGHATMLINFYGTWFLTDPSLRSHIGISVAGLTLGPRRIVQPALSISDLPELDAVLVSHSHMDHCDMGTLRRLPRKSHAVVQRHNGDLVRRFNSVSALEWGEAVEVNGARIEALEVNHWGARRLTDSHRGYGGFLITKNGRSIVFGGDTAYTKAFARLVGRAHVVAAMLPIGGYNPYIRAHANPEQAWEMRREMGATYILPMHHSTFALSHEPIREPIERLRWAAGSEKWRIAFEDVGETWTLGED